MRTVAEAALVLAKQLEGAGNGGAANGEQASSAEGRGAKRKPFHWTLQDLDAFDALAKEHGLDDMTVIQTALPHISLYALYLAH
jgi:hypothetical protein